MDRSRRTSNRTLVRAVAVLVVAASVTFGAAGCKPARPDDKSKPVLLIHGWAFGGGTDCGATFDRMISQLRSEGFTGPMIKVGFYTGDTNCDMTLRDWGSFDNGSSWVELSKALSKYVYETYTKKGKPVDIVGFSMGGNIARGAVYGTSYGEVGFSKPIEVEDVVTFGSPFNGAAWYTSFCLWGQCSTLKPGAEDLTWLNLNGDPQGVDGTEWTIFGSEADEVTPVDSALHMNIRLERKIRYTDVPHNGSNNYMGRPSVVTRAGQALAKVDS